MRYTYCLIVPLERLKNVEMYFVLLFAICYLLYLHTCTLKSFLSLFEIILNIKGKIKWDRDCKIEKKFGFTIEIGKKSVYFE